MGAAIAVTEGSLAARWRSRERFVVLATGPGSAARFLDAWRRWKGDPCRCTRLHWIALDPDRIEGDTDPCAFALAAAWPLATRNLHRLGLEDGRVQLLLAFGEPAPWLRQLVARVDVFLVGEPRHGDDWLGAEPRMAKSLARLAEPGAALTLCRPGPRSLDALRAVGFQVKSGVANTEGTHVEGDHADRSHTEGIHADYRPAVSARLHIGRDRFHPVANRQVLVIGGGLAGCAMAWALAESGWRCTLYEGRAAIAAAASGNPAGLFHGIVNGQDGSHARLHRAAALEVRSAVEMALTKHGVSGQIQGLLQLADPPLTVLTMRALATRLGLPSGYAEALDGDAASACAGLALDKPAWFYPGGGWIDPAGLARSFVTRAGTALQLHCNSRVEAIRRRADAWELVAADGRVIDSAPTVVLANAGDALRLLGADWPLEPVRGQLSWLDSSAAHPWALPRLPVAGSGYVVATTDGSLVFGATADPGDLESAVRSADHARNLAQLARLSPAYSAAGRAAITPAALQGRTAWRWTSRDRLPLIGAVPIDECGELDLRGSGGMAAVARTRHADQVRYVERAPGLFVFTGLGSRGITWSALGARILAAAITGDPAPVEASLLDAVDPARFGVRALRRRASSS